MTPPVYQIAKDSAAVTALLGNPPRLFLFGHAQQSTARPYAVWQLVYGSPDNSLSCVPTEDNYGVQFDCYAGKVGGSSSDGASLARDVAAALRDAYEETYNHVVSWNGEFWEQVTGLYRVSFTVEFWTERSS